jgi:L-ascorbate metabolism protein UlaG (beta-lactamase superfamily)
MPTDRVSERVGDGLSPSDPARPQHHTKIGFKNPAGSPERLRRRNKLLKFLWRQRIHAKKQVVPDDHVLPIGAVLDGLDAVAGRDSVTWLGHAAFLIRLAGQTILIDPFLSDYASPVQGVGPRRFTPPGLPVAALPQIDLLLVSHNHYDHLDAGTIAALPNKARIRVVVPLGLGRFFRRRGYRSVAELDWHQQSAAGPLTITAVPAIHRSARTLIDRNRTLWAGFVIESAERRLYFGGDTGYGAVFTETGRRYGPFDLAMLGIGCYAPRAAMHMNHANPEEAIQIALDLGARHVIGMHWGTIVMTVEPPFEPPVRFRTAATRGGYAPDEAWLMKVGETRLLPRGVIAEPDRPAD